MNKHKPKECAGGIVTNPFLEMLVVTNTIGRHTFPKGRIQEIKDKDSHKRRMETPLETAVREIHEESGIKKKELTLVRDLGHFSRPGLTSLGDDGPRVMKNIEMFYFTAADVILRPLMDDIVEARWVPLPAVPALLSWPEEVDFFMQNRQFIGAA